MHNTIFFQRRWIRKVTDLDHTPSRRAPTWALARTRMGGLR
jgi:hypothetical protein